MQRTPRFGRPWSSSSWTGEGVVTIPPKGKKGEGDAKVSITGRTGVNGTLEKEKSKKGV